MAAQIYYNIAIPAKQRQHVYNLVNFYLKRPYNLLADTLCPSLTLQALLKTSKI